MVDGDYFSVQILTDVATLKLTQNSSASRLAVNAVNNI